MQSILNKPLRLVAVVLALGLWFWAWSGFAAPDLAHGTDGACVNACDPSGSYSSYSTPPAFDTAVKCTGAGMIGSAVGGQGAAVAGGTCLWTSAW